MQVSILEALEPEKAADIVEEMAPDEAADILNELEEATSEEILDEMDSAPKTEVRELLEFEEDTAGGMMNTEYVSLHDNASVMDALAALRGNEDLLESLNTLFLVDEDERLTAAIPLARLFVASGGAKLKDLASETLIQVPVDETAEPRHGVVRQVQPHDPSRGGRGRQARRSGHRGRYHLGAKAEMTDAETPEPFPLSHCDLLCRPRPGFHHRGRR